MLRAIHVQSQQLGQQQHLQLYMVHEAATEPAPTVAVQVSSSTGTCRLDVLPDSGADISAAGQEVLEFLGQHINILPSGINPRTVNGLSMICVDLSHLNRYVQRERYQSPTPSKAVADITAEESRYFTVIDAAKGYHQCPLDDCIPLLLDRCYSIVGCVFLKY